MDLWRPVFTHFFIVRDGGVDFLGTTSGRHYSPNGHRSVPKPIPVFEIVSLTDVYGANEAFVTGTFAGVAPVAEVDGRLLGEQG